MRPSRFLHIVYALFVLTVVARPQPLVGQTKSPKAVVEEFWRMETQGGRLTDDGWRAADKYFVRPVAPPSTRTIGVVDNEFSIEDPYMRSNNTASVTINVGGLVWKLDPKMRISILSNQVKGFAGYELVLTDKHWEFAQDQKTLREVEGKPEWRIKEERDVWLTVDTAIRYLSQVHDTTTDPVIKKNTDESLAKLRQHRSKQDRHD